jgi:hypothetical protein
MRPEEGTLLMRGTKQPRPFESKGLCCLSMSYRDPSYGSYVGDSILVSTYEPLTNVCL